MAYGSQAIKDLIPDLVPVSAQTRRGAIHDAKKPPTNAGSWVAFLLRALQPDEGCYAPPTPSSQKPRPDGDPGLTFGSRATAAHQKSPVHL
jgi:hypothetical protein